MTLRIGNAARAIGLHDRAEDDPRRGFASHREFLAAVLKNVGLRAREDVGDDRLRRLSVFDANDQQSVVELAFLVPAAFTPPSVLAAAGSDEQGGYSDTFGGFAAVTSKAAGLLSATEGDPTAGRTMAIPMDTPVLELPARTDKNHTTSVSGGLTVSRTPETIERPSSRLGMEMVTLKAQSLVGLAFATEEVLTDSPSSFAALIDAGFRDEMDAVLLNEKIRGLGGDQYIGVLNSDARITVAKESGQTAVTIVADNVFRAAARCWRYDRAIWLANHDCRRQLLGLTLAIGTGGVAIYSSSTLEERPDALNGRPIFYSEHCSTLGTEGDLILVNWSQYLEGVYQPFQSAESIHVRFDSHERALKFWLRNAGAPWWRSELTPAIGADTLSPIVTLAARA